MQIRRRRKSDSGCTPECDDEPLFERSGEYHRLLVARLLLYDPDVRCPNQLRRFSSDCLSSCRQGTQIRRDFFVSPRHGRWIDVKKIYLTGYSMGGMEASVLAARQPDMFAAVVPGHKRIGISNMAAACASTNICIFSFLSAATPR